MAFTPSQVARMAAQVADALQGVAIEIAQAANARPEQIARAQEAVEDAKEVAAAFAAADDAGQARKLADRIEQDLTSVLEVAATLPLPSNVAIPLRIATVVVAMLSQVVRLLYVRP